MGVKDGDEGVEYCPWEVMHSTLSVECMSDPLPCLYKLRMCTLINDDYDSNEAVCQLAMR